MKRVPTFRGVALKRGEKICLEEHCADGAFVVLGNELCDFWRKTRGMFPYWAALLCLLRDGTCMLEFAAALKLEVISYIFPSLALFISCLDNGLEIILVTLDITFCYQWGVNSAFDIWRNGSFSKGCDSESASWTDGQYNATFYWVAQIFTLKMLYKVHCITSVK